jgi:hypothetical protein
VTGSTTYVRRHRHLRPSTTTTPSTADPTVSGPPTDDSLTATPSQTAVASQADAEDGDGGLPWAGMALGGGLIAVFGGAAVARSRRGGGP